MQTKEAIEIFLESRTAKGLATSSIKWYREILSAFAIQHPKISILPKTIEFFILSCQVGDERRHGYFRALRCFYRFMHRRYGLPNPMELIDPPILKKKLPRFLTPDQLDQLLSFPHAPRVKAALMFLADSGARVGELHRLKLSDIKNTSWGYVARVTGKTGSRFVPISNETYMALVNILPFNISNWWLRCLITRAFRDARVPGTAHTLRHTFATLWDGDETVLKEIMGHANIQTTMRYRHLRTWKLSAQHNEHSPLKMVLASSRSML